QPAVYAPTLGVWSEEDRFLTESQMQVSERYCQGPWTYQRLSGHHWIPLEQHERCSQLILEHIQALAE
ncbi:MAG: alpha/beta fold hydrolase, partial [Oceanococcaceae bacterium]